METDESNSTPTSQPETETKELNENSTVEEQLAWLRNQVTELQSTVEVLQKTLAESGLPIPTPEALATAAAEILKPELEAIQKMVNESQESEPLTPPEPTNQPLTDTVPMEPQLESVEESPAPQDDPPPEPAQRKRGIRKV